MKSSIILKVVNCVQVKCKIKSADLWNVQVMHVEYVIIDQQIICKQ